MNGIPLINGVEYSWADITCTIAGAPVTGITAVKYDDDQEVVNNYGAGRFPVSRSRGRITSSASISLYTSEIVAIQERSVNGRLQDIPAFDIIVSYIPTDGGKIIHDKIRNCQFKKNLRDWSEGDTGKSVELELVPSHIEWGK